MAGFTLRRGSTDTRRRLGIAVLVAVALHLPFTPLSFVIRLLGPWLTAHDASWDYDDAPISIPITLEEAPAPAPEPPPAPAEEPPAAAAKAPNSADDPASKEPKPKPKPKPAVVAVADAGATPEDSGALAAVTTHPEKDAGEDALSALAANDKGRDAGTDGAGQVAANEVPEGGVASTQDTSRVRDALSFTGAVGDTVKKNNVELVMWLSALRTHPLGGMVGALLTCNPQWQDFLGAEVDPLEDLNTIMIVGPRLTETSKVVVAVERHMDDAKTRRVFGALVKQSAEAGGWLDAGAGTIAARAHADRADRIVFTHPKDLVWVTPPDMYEAIHKRGPLSLPQGAGRVLALTLATPWRPLRGLGIALPQTLSELRMEVRAADDGGADVVLDFADKDAQTAQESAALLTDRLVKPFALFLGDVSFTATGNHVFAETHLSRMTGALILGFVRGGVCPSRAPDGGAGLR